MDYRTQMFRTKFDHAARQLGTAREQIVSLKLRENIGGYGEYQKLLRALQNEAGIKFTPADGDLQGHGYLLESSKTKIIIVEHETGLEILYIAGSVASLVGLIPLVLKCWSAVRSFRGRDRHLPEGRMEVRRLDNGGRLIEEHSGNPMAPWHYPFGAVGSALLLAAEKIDDELAHLRQEVTALTTRVAALEDNKTSSRVARKPRAAKKRAK